MDPRLRGDDDISILTFRMDPAFVGTTTFRVLRFEWVPAFVGTTAIVSTSIDMPFSTTFEAAEPTRAEIDARQGPLVLEFGTPWCGHCLAAQPLIEAAFKDFPAVPHIKIEDGRGRPLGRSYRVKLWPTLIFLESGNEVARLVRPTESAPIVEALTRIVDDLDSTAVRASE